MCVDVHVPCFRSFFRLCGSPPFQGKDEDSLYEIIKTVNVTKLFAQKKVWHTVSDEGKTAVWLFSSLFLLWSQQWLVWQLLFVNMDLKKCVGAYKRSTNKEEKNSNLSSLLCVAAKDCLREMLTVDPARRITAGELMDHPWMTVRKLQFSCPGAVWSSCMLFGVILWLCYLVSVWTLSSLEKVGKTQTFAVFSVLGRAADSKVA